MRMLPIAFVLLVACNSGESGPIDAFVGPGQDCSLVMEVEVTEPPPPALLDLVRACEADASQCDPLCRKILDDTGHVNDFLDTCTMQNAPSGHTVKIAYHLLCAD